MRVVALIAALVIAPASAEVYKCEVDGNTTFQDKPCAGSESGDNVVKIRSKPKRQQQGGMRQTEIKAFCVDKWPNDFRMQEHCLSKQGDGLDGLMRHVERLERLGEPALATIIVTCDEKWSRGPLKDYVMIDHCVSEQVAAMDRLGG